MRYTFYIFLIIVGLASCQTEVVDINVLEAAMNSIPVETSKNIEIIYSDSAIVRAKLSSPHLDNYKVENPYNEMPEGLTVLFYTPELEIESTLTANYGIRYIDQGVVEVKDNVIVVNKKGEKLNTERLLWDENTKRIFSDNFVKITTKEEIILGEGFESDQNFSSYKIFKIKGTISIADSAFSD
jgi:LPS export ABC transporter protein LptC